MINRLFELILMKFYDLNLNGQDFNNDLALVREASKFGWDFLVLNYSPDKYEEAVCYKNDLIEEIADFENPIEIDMGINIRNSNSNEFRGVINKFRNKTNYISCTGGDLKLNRSSLESYKLDVLSRPYFRRHDSGINHVLAKEAVKNEVAIELCFRDILKNYLKYRANVIANFKEILMFHRKFGFPLILTTGSKSVYDIRSTRDIIAFCRALGFTDAEIANGFYYYPKRIIEFNKDRKNMIVRGVKVIEGATDFTDKLKNDSDFEVLDDDADFNNDLGDDGL